MGSNRSAYQSEMDQVHLSDEKAKETLRKMLAENDAIREKEQKKTAKRFLPAWRWLPAVAAAAACLVLILTGAFNRDQNKSPAGAGQNFIFGNISVRKLPVSGVRGDDSEVNEPDISEPESLFPGWHISDARPGRRLRGLSPDGVEIAVTIEKDDVCLDAIVMKSKPELAEALAETDAYGKQGIRFNHDMDMQILSAVYAADGYYIVLFTEEMEEKDFAEAVMEVARK